jgi:hypothetical protein
MSSRNTLSRGSLLRRAWAIGVVVSALLLVLWIGPVLDLWAIGLVDGYLVVTHEKWLSTYADVGEWEICHDGQWDYRRRGVARFAFLEVPFEQGATLAGETRQLEPIPRNGNQTQEWVDQNKMHIRLVKTPVRRGGTGSPSW